MSTATMLTPTIIALFVLCALYGVRANESQYYMEACENPEAALSASVWGTTDPAVAHDDFGLPITEQTTDMFQLCHDRDETCENSETASMQCGVWLAPSSIPGGGLGMFAGRKFARGERLTVSGDLAIPIVDMELHQPGEWEFLWDEYTWLGKTMRCGYEGVINTELASPGFGSVANSVLDLYNVEEWVPQNDVPSGLHRSKDPGVGAFSYFHDRQTLALNDIEAGQELFVNYGDDWFEQRPQLGPIPLTGHHKLAQELYERFQRLNRNYPDKADILQDLWTTFALDSAWTDSRVLSAIPRSHPRVQEMLDVGLMEVKRRESVRSLDWLQDHGVCGDNLHEGISNIQQAGRGAFASRFLPKDAVIAPMPLIHVPQKNRLQMYNVIQLGKDDFVTNRTQVAGWQLLLNYCLGHEESSLLLCPYGPMVGLINHNQTMANAKLKWADPDRSVHDPSYLEKPVHAFLNEKTPKLAMEVVATRDILPGEEIYLDYGDAWEQAWQEHVVNWRPEDFSEEYVSAAELNQDESPLRTEFEQIDNPYPPNVFLLVNTAFRNRMRWLREYDEDSETDIEAEWAPCMLLEHQDINGIRFYTAGIWTGDTAERLVNIPREAFVFVDKPYSSDMHLIDAFRHEIMIPDSMFPKFWRNIRPGAN